MLKKETSQQYWNVRSKLFADYYKKPNLFDKIFRKAIYQRAAVAQSVINEVDDATILDIGSGPGLNAITWLKNSHAKSLTGIDFAPEMVNYAREMAEKEHLDTRAEFIEDDFMNYDFGETKFDVAVASGVFDYVENPQALADRAASLTKYAFIASWPKNGLRMALRRFRYTCPVYHYTEEQVKNILSKSGFTQIKMAVNTAVGIITIAIK